MRGPYAFYPGVALRLCWCMPLGIAWSNGAAGVHSCGILHSLGWGGAYEAHLLIVPTCSCLPGQMLTVTVEKTEAKISTKEMERKELASKLMNEGGSMPGERTDGAAVQ